MSSSNATDQPSTDAEQPNKPTVDTFTKKDIHGPSFYNSNSPDTRSEQEIEHQPETFYSPRLMIWETEHGEFCKAIARGDAEYVKNELDRGASIERHTDDGFSPLVIAIIEEQVEIVRLLLDNGASVYHRVKRLPPLIHALMKQDRGTEMMQILLDHGAVLNVISGPERKTALHWAASEGLAAAVGFLLDKGIDPKARCSKGRTPLIVAAEFGHTQVAKVLWTHGAEVNAQSDNGGTPLIWAACRNKVETLKFLLQQSVEIDIKDINGHTALSLASHFGFVEVVRLLLDYGANVNALSDKPKDCTPAMAAACSDSVDVLEEVISHGCDLNIRSAHGDNVLEVAMIERQEKAISVLLKAMGGERYPMDSVALQIATANGHAMIKGIMATAAIMHSYMEIQLGEPDKFAWMEWVLRQGGDVVKPLAMAKMMHAALEDRDLPMVRALVAHGCDLERRLESGHTPLSFAAGHRDIELTKLLMDAGADPNVWITDQNGVNFTPFNHVIKTMQDDSDTRIVDILLASGRCCINKGKDPASTAFSVVLGKSTARKDGRFDSLAIRMIDSIPNVNEDRDDIGCTLLHVAVHHQREDFVDLLLSRGADLEAIAEDGYTPFILACQYSPKMVPVLLERGANVHAKYKSEAGALHAAAAEGNLKALSFLTKLGLNIEQQTQKGYTPLACALTWGQELAALYLLEKGAGVTCPTLETNLTALHFAARNGLQDAVKEMLPQVSDVDIRDSKGWTPLHEACATGTPNVVSQLLEAGANIEMTLPNGDRPLHLALINENEDIALLLMESGADVSALASKDRTALHLAADWNLFQSAQAILRYTGKSLLEIPDNETWTPLCCCGDARVANLLIMEGANVNYKDKDGWTPLHQAIYEGESDVARVLVEGGASINRDCRTTDDGLTILDRAQDNWDWGESNPENKVGPHVLRIAFNRRLQRERDILARLEEAAEAQYLEKGSTEDVKIGLDERRHDRAMRELWETRRAELEKKWEEERKEKERLEKEILETERLRIEKEKEELEGLSEAFELVDLDMEG